MIFIDENVTNYINQMKEPNYGEDIVALSPAKAFQRLQNKQEVRANFSVLTYETFSGCPNCKVKREGNYCHTCGARIREGVVSKKQYTGQTILVIKLTAEGKLIQRLGNPHYSPKNLMLSEFDTSYKGAWAPSLMTLEDFMKIKYWFTYNN